MNYFSQSSHSNIFSWVIKWRLTSSFVMRNKVEEKNWFFWKRFRISSISSYSLKQTLTLRLSFHINLLISFHMTKIKYPQSFQSNKITKPQPEKMTTRLNFPTFFAGWKIVSKCELKSSTLPPNRSPRRMNRWPGMMIYNQKRLYLFTTR